MATHRELIPALCKRGHFDMAMEALDRLDVAASTHSYLCLLRCCARERDLCQARHVQAHVFKYNANSSGLLCDCLAVTLARCGALVDDTLTVLYCVPCRTVFSWTAIISAYADIGDGHEALRLHHFMCQDGIECDRYTYVSLFKACGSTAKLKEGMVLHSEAVKKGSTADVFVDSTLVSMYGKCHALAEAENVLARLSDHTVVAWNAMLSAYTEQGHGVKALQIFAGMPIAGVSPNYLSYVIALQACLALLQKEENSSTISLSNTALALQLGLALQADSIKKKLSQNPLVCSELITLFGRCRDVSKAEHVYMGLLEHSLICCTALLSVYVDQGHAEKALQFYIYMEKLGRIWNHVTLTCVLQACSFTGSLEICKHIHFSIISAGCEDILPVATTLLHSYGSCAYMFDAQEVFAGFFRSSLVLWNACITGHTSEGNSFMSLYVFENLLLLGILPDSVTFNSVLCVFSHSGLVAEGFEYFLEMKSYYGVDHDVKHHGIILDLLARAGEFKLVESVLQTVAIQADLSMWLSLLGASRLHRNIELTAQAFCNAVALQPEQDTAYAVMASLYSEWESVAENGRDNAEV